MLLYTFIPRTVVGLAGAAALAGCASIPADLGRAETDALVAERGIDISARPDEETRQLVDGLLAEPLSADDAIRIALLQNPRLRATYAQLGFAAADIYEAGRLSNPRFSASWLDSDESGAADQVTFGIAQSFTDLLLLRARSRLARGEFDRAKQAAASEIFSLAADVEAGWYELAGAEQIATMRRAVVKATTAAAELAERFFEAGNITHLELALERAAASEARLESLEARAAVIQQRTRLNRLLGLSGGASYEIVSGLPEPPAEEEGLDALMELSLASRLDLAAQRREVELLADNLGVTRRYRWLGAVGDVEIGAERERETDGSTLRGPTLALELPVFNQNADSITRAEAELAIAAAELDALQIEVSNAVRLAYAEVETARARLREHAEALVPLREEIVARTQEQVNFMLLGVFELLRVQREEYDAYQSYLEAARDYWLARVELERAVGTALPGAGAPVTAIDAGKLTGPAPMDMEGMQHSEPDAPTDKSGQMQHGERETPAEESGQMQHHKHDDGDTGTEENESPDHSEHGDQP